MRILNLFRVNPFRHFHEIRSVSEFAVANRATLCGRLGQQTEKYIYEGNIYAELSLSRRLRYRGSALITFAAHVSFIYLNSKYATRLSE